MQMYFLCMHTIYLRIHVTTVLISLKSINFDSFLLLLCFSIGDTQEGKDSEVKMIENNESEDEEEGGEDMTIEEEEEMEGEKEEEEEKKVQKQNKRHKADNTSNNTKKTNQNNDSNDVTTGKKLTTEAIVKKEGNTDIKKNNISNIPVPSQPGGEKNKKNKRQPLRK